MLWADALPVRVGVAVIGTIVFGLIMATRSLNRRVRQYRGRLRCGDVIWLGRHQRRVRLDQRAHLDTRRRGEPVVQRARPAADAPDASDGFRPVPADEWSNL